MGSMSPPMYMNGTGGGGGGMMAPPPKARRKMMMHMTFYWGNEATVLFKGFPGMSSGLYIVALVFIFLLCFLVELMSHSRWIRSGPSNVAAGLAQTVLYCVRIGLNYMAMLALMSFNGGIFIAAVVGHTLGFLLFGSRVFRDNGKKESDEP